MNYLKRKAILDESDMAIIAEVVRAPKNTLGPIVALMQSMEIPEGVVDEKAT